MRASDRWSRIYAVVRRVPRGRVTTYGEVALRAGFPGAARLAGHALAGLRGTKHDVPWQRVLAKASKRHARIAILDPMGAAVQQALLEREGVAVDERGRVALEEYGWRPRPARGARQPRDGAGSSASRRQRAGPIDS